MHHFHHGGHGMFAYDINEIVEFLDIKEGMKVADLGAGDGRFSYAFKEKGAIVYAFDVDDYYFKDMQAKGINTVKANLCKGINGDFDLVFMANVYHDLVRECKESILESLKIIAKSIAILDFNEKRLFGPPWRVKKEEAIEDMKKIGFELVKQKDLPYHYLLLFNKKIKL
ncbi:MAG: class I SAM-dependent methyltransferase [Nitrososphaeria archaeon]